jgi:hypothetical protein
VVVRTRNHGHLDDQWMRGEDVLDLNRRDVLAPADDDVLGAIANLDVAVGVHDSEVARVQALGSQHLGRGFRIVKIPGHHRGGADHDLPHRAAVGRNVGAQLVEHPHLVHDHGRHPLTGHQSGPLIERQGVPPRQWNADQRRPVRLRHAVEVNDRHARLLRTHEGRGWRRSAAHCHANGRIEHDSLCTDLCDEG